MSRQNNEKELKEACYVFRSIVLLYQIFLMAQFLDTTGISYRLEQIIKKADSRLILISPYLKINERIKELLEDKDRMKIDIRIIYGKNELLPEENNLLGKMRSIRSSFCKNLHAKCYLNEKEALITSMNLYEFSQVNNNEMGILVDAKEDEKLYKDIDAEVNRLIRISEEVRISVEKVPYRNLLHNLDKKGLGFCIRCRKDIGVDPTAPYCKECYASWSKWQNPEFEEKHCHICGKPNGSTILKPTCYNCYKEYKDTLTFPIQTR
jgi:phosphatidylserine/phosphatidylglycerophosphate/cardiolipin synthase-like enzyme